MLFTLDDQRCDELGIDRDNRRGRRDAETRQSRRGDPLGGFAVCGPRSTREGVLRLCVVTQAS